MRNAVLVLVIMASIFTYPAFAIEEEVFVQYSIDSYILLQSAKSNPETLDELSREVWENYGDYMEDIPKFSLELIADKGRQRTIFEKVLAGIKKKGYKAEIQELPNGILTIEPVE